MSDEINPQPSTPNPTTTSQADVAGCLGCLVNVIIFIALIGFGIVMFGGKVAFDSATQFFKQPFMTQLFKDPYDVAVNEAEYAHKQKNYTAAISSWNKAIELKPTSHYCYYSRAHEQKELKHLPQAIQDMNKAIELGPKDADYYYLRYYLHDKLKHTELALQDISKAIELKPNDVDYVYYRASDHHSAGHPKRALADISKAISMSPQKYEWYGLRAEWSREQGEYRQAIRDYTTYIENIDKPGSYYYFQLAWSHMKLSEYLAKVGDLDPLLEACKQADKAREFFNRAQELAVSENKISLEEKCKKNILWLNRWSEEIEDRAWKW